MSGYFVGIDLGTTHCVLASAPSSGDADAEVFAVPQRVGHGEVAQRSLLPSCLYAPPDGERGEGDDLLDGWLVGEHARRRGSELPDRAVTSAKSWLCHGAVDRRAAILPYQLEEQGGTGPKLSPVDANAKLLAWLRQAWDETYPAAPLAAQQLVLTVPASFDAVARALTVEAAACAGLTPRLLEEPQAAFYRALERDDGTLAALAQQQNALVLVCDVGGGTTDLSLMRMRGVSEVERVAVGSHLLLGGDNMDLALAHLCEQRLTKKGARTLEPRRFAQLVSMCRGAKEMLLAHGAPEAAPIRLVESGSQLVGTALSCELGRDEVREVVLDGFFPLVARDDASVARRGGLRAFGLPYERDVAITRHLAAFVRRHAGDEPIAAVLLNGGVFEAKLVAERIVEVLAGWAQASGRQVVSVPLHDPNLSVALGAVAYGRALAGRGVTIGGGSARGYYLGLSGSEQLVSILPRGSEEGVTTRAGERRFLLRVGEPARFEVLAADDGHDGAGAMVTRDPERHQLLPPLVATLPGDKGTREVGLEASLSAIGTLDVACVAGGDHAERYALEFELRSTSTTGAPHTARLQSAPADRYGKRLDEARGAIDAVLGKAATEVASRDIKGLTRALEKILGKRERWALDLNRALFDALFRHYKRRRRSAEHERTFWSLAGYTLRPGVGHPKDDERVRGLQRLFAARLAHPGELRSWQQYWIAWRRIAAGLDEGMQGEIFAAIAPWVAPAEAELKKSKGFRNDAQFEMLDLAACLECLPAGQRAELGGWILERTWTSRDARLWAALGRVGARTPTYASLHHVVATRTVERWLDHLLREKWQQLPTAARAATAMARMTNDRGRDISDGLRKRVLDRFTKLAIDEQLRKPIDQLVQFDDADRSAFYGADLPAGLALAESSPAGDARSVDPQR